MIKGVLFDLDGTLLDRDASLLRFTEDQYERFPELQRVDRDQYIRRFVELDARGYVWKDKVYEQLVREMDLSCPGSAFWRIISPVFAFTA
ncbi:HAD hydrolase-like protein [Paenibacillus sp. Y412MC10]|uniref:HAD hydrolase-like protein n=1 Tax=Geobacillus sp. (strain Y412MC10) TaxID=481743 RepID=UPI0028CB5955|nr:HAD hydrolase-like protein [Paenibacillus sp. Y412MC10]